MPVDPRLNCAAEICCPPPQAKEAKLTIARDLLKDFPVSTGTHKDDQKIDMAQHLVNQMEKLDIQFAPGELMRAIRSLADHPGGKRGNITEEEAEKFTLD